MECDLCSRVNTNNESFKKLVSSLEFTTLSFLKGNSKKQNSFVCSPCYDNISFISNLRHQVSVFKDENSDSEELEEINQLSTYLTNSSDEKCHKNLSCLLCSTQVTRLTSLKRHYVTLHNYSPPIESLESKTVKIQCLKCPLVFSSNNHYIQHALSVHVEKNKEEKISCKLCQYSVKKNNIEAHHSYAHSCTYCSSIFPNRKIKNKHLATEHGAQMTNVCEKCGAKFENVKCLQKHLRSLHEKENTNTKCPKCSLIFPKNSSSRRLKSHLQKFHAPDKETLRASYKFSCLDCGLKVKHLRLLESHKQLRHGENVTYVQCPFCEYKVPRKRKSDIYRYHIQRMHKDQDSSYTTRLLDWKNDLSQRAKIHCLLCSYAGTKRSNLSRHYTHIHDYNINKIHENDPDGALCPECGEHFQNKHILIAHLLKVHTRTTGESCLYCNFRYNNIQTHIDLKHREEREQKEQHCNKCVPQQVFISFDDLLRHTRTYHRKVVKTLPQKKNRLCEMCGKSVASMTMRRHRSECKQILEEESKPIKSQRYVPVHLSGICPFCDLKFSDLLGHIRHRHSKVQSQKSVCDLCTESFSSVRELVTHRQLHPTFKYHVCSACKSEFESVVELRSHRKDCTRKSKRNLENKSKSGIEYEDRGTVPCHICQKNFTLKTLLRRHYIGSHSYEPLECHKPSGDEESTNYCTECSQTFFNRHSLIKHYLDFHAVISGQICPYCESRKKFEMLDKHVAKYHIFEMQSPIQTCSTCKTNFNTYEELKNHRQHHEGGNRRISEFTKSSTHDPHLIVHSKVGAYGDIGNKGGVKCQLCNAFKIRKEHLKIHYIKHHGYDPKYQQESGSLEDPLECPICSILFPNNHILIKHLLKSHCSYSGLICPYCKGHFPERYLDLQKHVASAHMECLTGYNVSNHCKVCRKIYAGYAELRDHVQIHGDAYRDPYGNPEAPRKYAAKKRKRLLTHKIPQDPNKTPIEKVDLNLKKQQQNSDFT